MILYVHIIEIIIVLALLILISNVISHYLPAIPLSLIQIVLGLLTSLSGQFQINLSQDWFLLVFIAPLLYTDGRRFPKRELWRMRGPILGNAILLVFLTTIVGGYLIYQIIPKIPLAEAFALAAILSPTDPIAVQSIAKRAKLPDSILHLVSGESLINDASGLVAFKYALAAVITGTFSLTSATGNFIYIGVIGIIAGIILSRALDLIQELLLRNGVDDVVFHTAIQLVSPFLIYIVIEEVLHASGVIGVVAAGVTTQFGKTPSVEYRPELRVVSSTTWDVLNYLLNGFVFMLLGNALPRAMENVIEGDRFSTVQALSYAFLTWLIILLIRIIWSYIYMIFPNKKNRGQKKGAFRYALLAGLSGVRGAVTMAGILSLPLRMPSGAPFPERDLVLFIASGVVIFSLLAAVITLPLVAPNSGPIITRGNSIDKVEEDEEEEEELPQYLTENEAYLIIVQTAVSRLNEKKTPKNQRAAYELMLDYQNVERQISMEIRDDDQVEKALEQEIVLREVAIEGERKAIERLYNNKQIGETIYQDSLYRIEQEDKNTGRLTELPKLRIILDLRSIKRYFHRFFRARRSDHESTVVLKEARLAERESAKAAIKALSRYVSRDDVDKTKINRNTIYHLVIMYRNRIERLKGKSNFQFAEYQKQRSRLQMVALGAQRASVQSMLETGRITRKDATKLRTYINYSENALTMDIDAK
ncbi:NhaP-type Na+ H+ and K+ H+ antiporter [Ligilactobacillus pobuzihii E100301 = KCTC 13174]|uniref:NhaP-type Na+ H+ and K+ H+ antiporter n=1 Tax=Ligilactobacillus pobuzihii TaxID=449659 RepID=A0A0R2L9M3_9LACO|nr:NhaP-type Na+ H+ and K+ H+ antiporter [Ligilactobacillus pobuzihii E100301 = KCTC 13174]KRN95818.1 NhaP-type Na+ H+ and K+ H+ antiporter [Ligilactobacillus pobuzihii]